ncbi:uncharacterized protein K452DRAFT_283170 [Aplosporella prunicola CBS 121167]|uniref:Ubiquitin 3 binding protein But2 C-terminal domain-containing protein n=1 Tax=Aplosporella prunicola CBS 121167 TaxID=1176127 RepID=A0A6A6BQ40_9PEZI|nr:uncharacterized protein K452DRAFT_283170 [Aplosporella prunicola CBS 121167]KAF2145868.1 hypothetical protein K452DRAFT_283170 [Aplosporella prunicola CBS 121167]
MRSTIATSLAFLGAASAQSATTTSTVLSFAFPFGASPAVVPTAGVTGSVVGVESARTTLAFTCAEAAKELTDYSSVGVLCPIGSNTPMTVTYGPSYFAQSAHTTVETATLTAPVDLNIECDVPVAATPASNSAKPTATKDAVCTYDFGDNELAEAMGALFQCSQENVAGPVAEIAQSKLNTASVTECIGSAMQHPATTAAVTYKATDVVYWTVTVTDVAKGVTLEGASSKATGSAASASASASAKDNAAAGSFGARLSAAGVVGLAAGVLAL